MNDDPSQPRRRRARYQGTHPRRFEEKYKELSPDRYAAEQAKVKARGHTPAGTHRPILVAEILAALDPKPGQRALDATLGYGGHAAEVLARLQPGGHLVGLDVDPLELPKTEARLRALGFGAELLSVRRTNFASLAKVAAEDGPFDLVLADLGVSSMQIDTPSRGFTWKADAPLDLRLNPQKGRPAADLVARLDARDLAELLVANADEPEAERLAAAIAARPPRTTRELADLVRGALEPVLEPGSRDVELRKALQRTFQALRIAVNDEYGVLDRFLAALPQALASGGRVAILTFHSGEDRRVKKAFQQGHRDGLYADIAAEPQRPSAEERRDNPRSTSAKLRWALRA